jgi:hypothetical protein
MVWWRLTNAIGIVLEHLYWISHILNNARSFAKVQMLNELLRTVENCVFGRSSKLAIIKLNES